MKSFKQLITESMAELINEYTVEELLGQNTSNIDSVQKKMPPTDEALKNIDDVNRGILLGECFKEFERSNNNYILVSYSKNNRSRYAIKKVSEQKIDIPDDNSFIISRGYISKRFGLLGEAELQSAVRKLVTSAMIDKNDYSYGSLFDMGFSPLNKNALVTYKNDRTVQMGSYYGPKFNKTIKAGGEIHRLVLKVKNDNTAQNNTKDLKMYSSTVTNVYPVDSAKKCVLIGGSPELGYGYVFVIKEAKSYDATKTVYIVRKEELSNKYPLFSSPAFLANFAATIASTESLNTDNIGNEPDEVEKQFIGCPSELQYIAPNEFKTLKKIAATRNLKFVNHQKLVIPKNIFASFRDRYPNFMLFIKRVNAAIQKISRQKEIDRKAGMGRSAKFGKHSYS